MNETEKRIVDRMLTRFGKASRVEALAEVRARAGIGTNDELMRARRWALIWQRAIAEHMRMCFEIAQLMGCEVSL